jgi:hypothetical protein
VGPTRSFERDALQLVAQHPNLSASAQLLDESLFVSPHAQTLLPVFSWWLWGKDTSRHALVDSAPPELAGAVLEIIMDEIRTDDVDAYGEELLMRLMIAKTERQMAELKDHVASNPEDREAFGQLRALRVYRDKLKG